MCVKMLQQKRASSVFFYVSFDYTQTNMLFNILWLPAISSAPSLPPSAPPPMTPLPPYIPGTVDKCVISAGQAGKCGIHTNNAFTFEESIFCVQYKIKYQSEPAESRYGSIGGITNKTAYDSISFTKLNGASISLQNLRSDLIQFKNITFYFEDTYIKAPFKEFIYAYDDINSDCTITETSVCKGHLCNMPNLLTHPPNAPPVQNAPNAPPSPSTMPYIVAIVALSVVVLLTACWCVWRCDIVAQETPQTSAA